MSAPDRRLTPADVDACMRLVAEAGWNQTANDWNTILTVGEGRGLFRDGQLIATAAIIPHGTVGWVCMVLVTASEQRRGYATKLLEWAGARLTARGLTPGLDATPAGRQVYLRQGYRDIYSITRLQCDALVAQNPNGCAIRSATPEDLEAMAALDRSAFVLDRTPLLASLLRRQPGLAKTKFVGSECVGFVLGREGGRATQVGPLVAVDDTVAADLLGAVLSKIDGPAYIDVPDRHVEIHSVLRQRGFTSQRQFTRMLHGRSEPFDDAARVFALTGPEFA
ncbi:GNAT family N-acetyltransferase [Devosia sp. 1566]|uniref:GNAT family N-acetyltransferase n=1 Tax=Devosia sp. 1566 TaxID=2499144 RepID=UPI000FD8537D|nr:GNAT family N-acetyltransferase [Devosia sp. 1566]